MIATLTRLTSASVLAGLALAGACATTDDDVPVEDVVTPGGGKSDAYGSDTRVDLHAAGDAVRTVGRSIALVLDTAQLHPLDTGEVALLPFSFRTDTLAQVMEGQFRTLCAGEKFRDQPVRGRGTAFLIAPDLVATAGHVGARKPCAETALVFDYAYTSDPATRPTGLREITTRPASSVYRCKEVIFAPGDEDLAIMRLDRPVTDRFVLPLVTATDIPMGGAPLAIVGHPTGIAMKFAGGRVIERAYPIVIGNTTFSDPTAGFLSSLPAYQGNSGSPVFSPRGIEGVLVAGGRDWAWHEAEQCWQSKVCPDDAAGCDGNYVMHASRVRAFMP